jgi:site-specific DNA-cytosine methylase
MRALGIHTFAGGFSYGVQQIMDVKTHLEVHGFGLETAKKMCNVEIHNSPAEDWPDVAAEFAFGNPRCTGFSTITSGYSAVIHGPFSNATRDIIEFCNYCTDKFPIFTFESVQQAYSTGRPLLNKLVEQVSAAGYRVAHLFVNSGSFGNAQHRKRYFFVAYDKSKNFNIEPPTLPSHRVTLFDAIWHLRHNKQDGTKFNSITKLTPEEQKVIEMMPNGWDLNTFAVYNSDILPERMKDTYLMRRSALPFSLHCPRRLVWTLNCPTIFSSAGRFIHPDQDRPLTLGEISTIMGWPEPPHNENNGACIAEIAKGVCPCVGEWVATQAAHYLNDAWGSDDYESSYKHLTGEWIGKDCNGSVEKVFNLTHYLPSLSKRDYPYEEFRMRRHNVDEHTGKLLRPWTEVSKSYWNAKRGDGLDWTPDHNRENILDEQDA